MHDKQLEDWNLKPPPLCLWSRRDWTLWHKEIAIQHSHIFQQRLHVVGDNVRNYLMEEDYDCYQDYSYLNPYGDFSCMLDGVPEVNGEAEPEGAGSSSPDKVKQSYTHCDGKEYDGVSRTERLSLTLGNSEGWTPDMSIDMELSSPTHSPTCSKALREAFGTPEMETTQKGCQDKQRTPGQDFPVVENGRIQTGYPTVPEERHRFQSGANHYRWHNMDTQSQWYTGSFSDHFGQRWYSDGRQVRDNWQSQQYTPVPQRNQNPSSQEFMPPNFNSGFQHYGSSSLDYSRTPMMRGSGQYRSNYRPEYPHANRM